MATKKAKAETAAAEPAKHPTILEAKAMFEENPGLAEVLTEAGWVKRHEALGGAKVLGLDGYYR